MSVPAVQASELHEVVWSSAAQLWDLGRRTWAIGAAANAVERQLKVKLGVTRPSGADLVVEAFNPAANAGDVRLRFPQYAEGTRYYEIAHESAMSFGRGCFLGIRNATINAPGELEEQLALEYLAALSVLARWVDEALVVTV